jgi:hypothetical protein
VKVFVVGSAKHTTDARHALSSIGAMRLKISIKSNTYVLLGILLWALSSVAVTVTCAAYLEVISDIERMGIAGM